MHAQMLAMVKRRDIAILLYRNVGPVWPVFVSPFISRDNSVLLFKSTCLLSHGLNKKYISRYRR